MQQPKTWEQCEALLSSDQMEKAIKARLLWLIFNVETAVAFNAGVFMLENGGDAQAIDLSGVSTETLEKAQQLALDYILKIESESQT